jgi:hypothetical protein
MIFDEPYIPLNHNILRISPPQEIFMNRGFARAKIQTAAEKLIFPLVEQQICLDETIENQ